MDIVWKVIDYRFANVLKSGEPEVSQLRDRDGEKDKIEGKKGLKFSTFSLSTTESTEKNKTDLAVRPVRVEMEWEWREISIVQFVFNIFMQIMLLSFF